MVAPFQQRMQSPVSVPRLLPGQFDQGFPQGTFRSGLGS